MTSDCYLELLLLRSIHSGFQGRSGLEGRLLGCLDLNGLSGGRIATTACGTFADFECTESDQGNIVTLLQSGGDDFDQCSDITVSVGLAAACFGCQCINQFFAVHSIFSLS